MSEPATPIPSTVTPGPSTLAPSSTKKPRVCQFYNTPQGCRKGETCVFAHIAQAPKPKNSSTRQTKGQRAAAASSASKANETPPEQRNGTPTVPKDTQPPTRISQPRTPRADRQPVQRPVPKVLRDLESAATEKMTAQQQELVKQATLRAHEIGLVKTRFASTFTDLTIGSSFEPSTDGQDPERVLFMAIVPSDPDFPFDIESLEVELHVPAKYPSHPCWLQVKNKDIPVGFARNLEKGFEVHTQSIQRSLLANLNWLDVNMEELLQKPPAATIRFVSNTNNTAPNASSPSPSRPSAPPLEMQNAVKPKTELEPESRQPVTDASTTATTKPTFPPVSVLSAMRVPISVKSPPPEFTLQQLDNAKVARDQQIGQLQARFRASFKKLSPTRMKLDLEPANKDQLPIQLSMGLLTVVVVVPIEYPLVPCEVRLRDSSANPELEHWRAGNVEEAFRKYAAQMTDRSLFQHLNQLNRDLKAWMNQPEKATGGAGPKPTSLRSTPPSELGSSSSATAALSTTNSGTGKQPALATSNWTMAEHKPILIDRPAGLPAAPKRESSAGIATNVSDTDDSEGGEDDDDYDNDMDGGYQTEENSDSDENSDDLGEAGEEETTSSTTLAIGSGPKRGIAIRMPDMLLENISLLYCSLLNLLVRCNRCKSLIEIPNLKPTLNKAVSDDATTSSIAAEMAKKKNSQWKTCDTCSSVLGAHFETEYIHATSRTIGHIDLAGCTAYDILPSNFVPTCAGCDHVLGAPTVTAAIPSAGTEGDDGSSEAVKHAANLTPPQPTGFRQQVGRSMSAVANCRACHLRLTLTLNGELKFVRLALGQMMKADQSTLEQLPLRRKNKSRSGKDTAEMGIAVGQPLPRLGACDHFKKSRRWFRFPCCSKIYPCPICHDASEDHEIDSVQHMARKMICGHCSRESTISDKPCICGASPVRVHRNAGGSAFWEGGEGVRDKVQLSRNDSHKFKGNNKTVAKKQVGAENVRKRAPKS